eukprot:g4395.t1
MLGANIREEKRQSTRWRGAKMSKSTRTPWSRKPHGGLQRDDGHSDVKGSREDAARREEGSMIRENNDNNYNSSRGGVKAPESDAARGGAHAEAETGESKEGKDARVITRKGHVARKNSVSIVPLTAESLLNSTPGLRAHSVLSLRRSFGSMRDSFNSGLRECRSLGQLKQDLERRSMDSGKILKSGLLAPMRVSNRKSQASTFGGNTVHRNDGVQGHEKASSFTMPLPSLKPAPRTILDRKRVEARGMLQRKVIPSKGLPLRIEGRETPYPCGYGKAKKANDDGNKSSLGIYNIPDEELAIRNYHIASREAGIPDLIPPQAFDDGEFDDLDNFMEDPEFVRHELERDIATAAASVGASLGDIDEREGENSDFVENIGRDDQRLDEDLATVLRKSDAEAQQQWQGPDNVWSGLQSFTSDSVESSVGAGIAGARAGTRAGEGAAATETAGRTPFQFWYLENQVEMEVESGNDSAKQEVVGKSGSEKRSRGKPGFCPASPLGRRAYWEKKVTRGKPKHGLIGTVDDESTEMALPPNTQNWGPQPVAQIWETPLSTNSVSSPTLNGMVETTSTRIPGLDSTFSLCEEEDDWIASTASLPQPIVLPRIQASGGEEAVRDMEAQQKGKSKAGLERTAKIEDTGHFRLRQNLTSSPRLLTPGFEGFDSQVFMTGIGEAQLHGWNSPPDQQLAGAGHESAGEVPDRLAHVQLHGSSGASVGRGLIQVIMSVRIPRQTMLDRQNQEEDQMIAAATPLLVQLDVTKEASSEEVVQFVHRKLQLGGAKANWVLQIPQLSSIADNTGNRMRKWRTVKGELRWLIEKAHRFGKIRVKARVIPRKKKSTRATSKIPSGAKANGHAGRKVRMQVPSEAGDGNMHLSSTWSMESLTRSLERQNRSSAQNDEVRGALMPSERSVGMAMSNGCIVRSRPNTVVRNKRPEFANDVESGARGQGDNNEAGENAAEDSGDDAHVTFVSLRATPSKVYRKRDKGAQVMPVVGKSLMSSSWSTGQAAPNKGGEGSVQQWHMPWKSQPLKFTGWSEVADGETMGITDKRRVLMDDEGFDSPDVHVVLLRTPAERVKNGTPPRTADSDLGLDPMGMGLDGTSALDLKTESGSEMPLPTLSRGSSFARSLSSSSASAKQFAFFVRDASNGDSRVSMLLPASSPFLDNFSLEGEFSKSATSYYLGPQHGKNRKSEQLRRRKKERKPDAEKMKRLAKNIIGMYSSSSSSSHGGDTQDEEPATISDAKKIASNLEDDAAGKQAEERVEAHANKKEEKLFANVSLKALYRTRAAKGVPIRTDVRKHMKGGARRIRKELRLLQPSIV